MINFAHRGASSDYPENTILALKEGIKSGASGLEIDVHKSKDNINKIRRKKKKLKLKIMLKV